MDIKVLAIVMARMGSTRLPNKVLKKIGDKTLIEILLERLSLAKNIDKIILATSTNKENDILENHVKKLGYSVFRGSENDVLSRYYHASVQYSPKSVMRITGDCPLIDPNVVDNIINLFWKESVDYVSNIDPPTFPDGLDTEIFSFNALKKAHEIAVTSFEREHVTPIMREKDIFSRSNLNNDVDYSIERWTVDDPEDFEVVKSVVKFFAPNLDFSWTEILKLKKLHPEKFEANRSTTRNEGSLLGAGQKLYKRAKKIIPGGNMLLSKRPEMFLPDQWPSYFSKAKGCNVWDLDGQEYIDMSIMGIGTNVLGYGHSEVDEAVRNVVEKGNMSTFNCPEEVYLAERLIDLHPWSDMVRFARTGGEANSIAIRIARAFSGKDKVAFCGYHGWHDWYLSANLGNENSLDGHLLSGLDPKGVPKNLSGTMFPFNYNNIEELESIISKNDIGIIKMEVSRNDEPKDGFLDKVRKIATDNKIILIFDECTSGFRETFGGIHKKYNVEPDIAIFGKALGNGYAITSIIGRKSVMDAAQSTFISSTFWTERIGPSAALKTLEIMEKEKSWEQITDKGIYIREKWKVLSEKHNLKISFNGIPSIGGFSFDGPNSLKLKTLVSQEMLKRGYLASTLCYVCISHTKEIIDIYIENLDQVFSLISNQENMQKIDDLLEGPVCHSGFKRLN